MHRTGPTPLPRLARVLALCGLAALGGCVLLGGGDPARYGVRPRASQVARILDVDEPSPAFYRERARLEVMGPELDPVLVSLVEDRRSGENVRANALVLLADRRSPGTLALLRRQLDASPSDVVRAAAVLGLQRFIPDSAGARDALRAAATDPSARVRLNVLQRLDVEDAPLVRALLEREEQRQVRTIARQLLTLLEARGAPLVRDARGDLRTGGPDDAPQIVFHPRGADAENQVETGALWVEVPRGALVPLAPRVDVVAGVVPAFFDPQRAVVVYESDQQVVMRDLRSGETRTVGPGIAPRVVPFSDWFVYVRPLPGAAGPDTAYAVMRASFAGGVPQEIGELRASARADVRGGASPVRWMVVGEARDGFVLRAPGMTPFVLPGPYEVPPPIQ